MVINKSHEKKSFLVPNKILNYFFGQVLSRDVKKPDVRPFISVFSQSGVAIKSFQVLNFSLFKSKWLVLTI